MKKFLILLSFVASVLTMAAQPLLVGHRGSYWGVENTAEAFINGAKKGYHYLECDETSLFNKLLPAVDAKDYPGMADIDASLLYFCSLVSKTNKVALTGECADEIFGGYPWCYKNNLTDNCNFPWISDTSARSCLLKDEWISRLNLEEYSQEKYKSELNKIEYLSNEKTDERNHRAISS